jgi:uncharacterized protein (TIGR03437 family)
MISSVFNNLQLGLPRVPRPFLLSVRMMTPPRARQRLTQSCEIEKKFACTIRTQEVIENTAPARRHVRLLAFLLLSAACRADDRLLSSGTLIDQNRGSQTIHFEPNRGQVKGHTEWMAQARGAAVYITGPEVVFALGNDNAHMRFIGATPKSKSTGLQPSGAYSNYFLGPAERTWFTGIPQYASVRYSNIYPGIDIVYHTSNNNVEYDFVLASGANPHQIELAFDREVHIDDQGDLVAGHFRQHRPRVVQEGREIPTAYELTSDHRAHIKLGRYQPQEPLTIDPVLEFSTYLGGPGFDTVSGIRLDSAGNILLSGSGLTPATPMLDPFQQTNRTATGGWFMKLTPDGKRVLFYTIFNAGQGIAGFDIAPDGNLMMTGVVDPGALPLRNAFQTTCSDHCGFIAKLTPDGRTLIFSSYLAPGALALDAQGNAFVVGTASGTYPTKNPVQTASRGVINCFISRVSSAGEWIFSTYLGSTAFESCSGPAVDQDGNLLFTGHTVAIDFPMKNATQTASNPGPFGAPFFVKMAPDGSLLYSSYFGGDNFSGWGQNVAVDQAGHIYLTGRAFNPFFTLKNAYQTVWNNDGYGFLMKMDGTPANLVYSTFFSAWFQNVAVDKDENVYAIALASSPDVPLKNSLQEFLGGGVTNSDALIAKFASSGNSLVYSTLLGGTREDWATAFALDNQGTVYLGGFTWSSDFPVKNAYQPAYRGGQQDGFLAKISDNSSAAASPLELSPALAGFQYVQGGSIPPSQSIAVAGTESYFLTTSPTWISATPSGPGPPNSVQISVNPAGLPPGTATGAVTLHPTSGDPAATIDVSVTVYAPAPVLTSIAPALVAIGSDDTVVTITGSGFVTGSTVLVNNIAWSMTPVTIVNSTTITFKLPKLYFAGLISYPISVQNPQSLASNSLSVSVGNPAPAIATAGIVNAASYAPPPVSVGELVVIFGSNFGSVDTTSVLFENVPGKIIYVTPTQLAATVPAGAGSRSSISIQVQTSHDVYSAPVTVDMSPSAPALFTSHASGKGPVAAINQDNTVNSASNSAPAASVVALYATGGGTLTSDSLPRLSLPVTATIGGLDAQVLYAGVAPGEPDGVIQINVMVPAGLPSATADIVVKIGGSITQAGVTLAVK